MITLLELKKRILINLEAYVSTAASLTDDETYAQKICGAIDEAIKFAVGNKTFIRSWSITQPSNPNRIMNQDEHYTHENEDISFSVDRAYAYYFEVDDAATIIISQSGKTLLSIEHPAQTGDNTMTVYKGVIPDVSDGEVTVTFKGDYFYGFQNVALYGARFSSAARIPDYSYWTKHALPANHFQIQDVSKNGGGAEYQAVDNMLWLRTGDAGTFTIQSTFFPDSITDSTANTAEIDIPTDTIAIVVNKACSIMTRDGSDSEEYKAEANTGMQNLDNRETQGAVTIVPINFDW